MENHTLYCNFNIRTSKSQAFKALQKKKEELLQRFLANYKKRDILKIIKNGIKTGYKVVAITQNSKGEFKKPLWKGDPRAYKPSFRDIESKSKGKKITYGVITGEQPAGGYLVVIDFDFDGCEECYPYEIVEKVKALLDKHGIEYTEEKTFSGRYHIVFISGVEVLDALYKIHSCYKITEKQLRAGAIEIICNDKRTITLYNSITDDKKPLFEQNLKVATEKQVMQFLTEFEAFVKKLSENTSVSLEYVKNTDIKAVEVYVKALKRLYKEGFIDGFEADLYITGISIFRGLTEDEALQMFRYFWEDDYNEELSRYIYNNAIQKLATKTTIKTENSFITYVVEHRLGREYREVRDAIKLFIRTHAQSFVEGSYDDLVRYLDAMYLFGIHEKDIEKHTEERTLYYYDFCEGIWKNAETLVTDFIYTNILNLVEKNRSRFYDKEILKVLKANTENKIVFSDPPPTLIPLKNGVFDLENNTFREFSPTLGFRDKFNFEYDPSAKCEKVEQFLRSLVSSEDDYTTLWEFIAYTLYKEYTNSYILMLYGSGGNGKTTFVEFLTRLLNEKNVVASDLNSILNYDFEIVDVKDKLLLALNDEGKTELNAEEISVLKRLTGDLIRAKRKHKSHTQFKNFAKILITTNNPPIITDRHYAIFRRLIPVHFPFQFVNTNTSIDIKELFNDEKELEGAFNKALRYLVKLYNNKFIFTKHPDPATAYREYEKISNPLHRFIRETCVFDTSGRIPKAEFVQKYYDYCRDRKLPVLSGRALQKIKATFETYGVTEGVVKIKGNAVRCWLGVRWKDDKDDDTPDTPIRDIELEPTQVEETPSTDTEKAKLPELPPVPTPVQSITASRTRKRSSKAKKRSSNTLTLPKQSEIINVAAAYTQEEIERALSSYVSTDDKAEKALEVLLQSPVWYLDLETYANAGEEFDPHANKIRLFTVSDGERIFIFDWLKISETVKEKLLKALPTKTVIGHNLKFDLKTIYAKYKLPYPERIFDTYIAEKLIYHAENPQRPQRGELSLDALAEKYLNVKLTKTLQKSDFSGELTKEQITYAYKDVEVLPAIVEKQIEKLNALNSSLENPRILNLKNLVATLEMLFLQVVVELELVGVPINFDYLEEKLKEYKELVEKHRQFFEKQGVNPNSSAQVLKWLQAQGIEIESTRKELLAYISDKEPVRALLEYRKANKIYKEIEKLIKSVKNGRVFPEFQQLGAITGRMSAKNPNLQQVPREIKPYIYKPAQGKAIVKADFPAIELRIASVVASDRIMQEAFAQGKDLHKLTASILSGKPYEEITKDERQKAKAVNFGLLYGMGAQTLKEYAYTNYGVELTDEEAEEIIEKFFSHYKGLAKWHDKTAKKFLKSSVVKVKTLLGRVCAADGLTNALNYPVQGSGADLLKLSCVRFKKLCDEKGIDAKIINLVHDEIVVEVDKDKAEETAKLLKEAMESSCNDLFKVFDTEVEVEIIK